MQRISIAPVCFTSDINLYANWRRAFWRELFQNSIDQGATEIVITIQSGYDCLVTFKDNGSGMSREVLETVYFAMGATTKTSTDTIGGFGRARVLTCFAMERYQIRSQDYVVKGIGGDYDVMDSATYFDGCELTIGMRDCDAETASQHLYDFLAESRIPARVTVNGALSTTNSGHYGRHLRNLTTRKGDEFAKVYVNKSQNTKKLLVRVNGVVMFSDTTSVEGQIVVELLPEVSRRALTANRDSLRWEYSSVLSTFQQELATNEQSTVRDRSRRQTTIASGGGLMKAFRRTTARSAAPSVFADSEPSRVAFRSPEVPVRRLEPEIQEYVTSEEQTPFQRWLSATFGDIFITDDTNHQPMRKGIAQYLPTNWTLQEIGHSGRFSRRGGNIVKVLLAWKVACQYALEIAMDYYEISSVSWGVGFTFSEAPASCQARAGGHVFYLRPVNMNGNLDFSVTDRGDLLRIMTSAKHEITHIRHSWHNESFSATREIIDERFDQVECLRRIKAAIAGMVVA